MASEEQATPQRDEVASKTTTSPINGTTSNLMAEQKITQGSTVQSSSASVAEPTAQEPPPNPRLHALATKKANLEATLATLQAEKAALIASSTLPSGLAMPGSWSEEEKTKSALANANSVIKEHIALLHKYNEIKDIGQGLMGLIAESRGVRNRVVMEEYGMGEGD